MNKLIQAIFLAITLSVGIFAQSDADDYQRNEFYAGFSNQSADGFPRRSTNGFETAYVRNVHRYLGIKGDFSAAYKNERFDISVPDFTTGATTATYRQKINYSIYNFLGGIQIKDNASKARFKPFGHALAGVAYSRAKFDAPACLSGNCTAFIGASGFTFTETGFSAALGGGLDIKLNDRLDFRAIQVDYNPIRVQNQWNNNVRFGIGFVFK